MKRLIHNGTIINEGAIYKANILIENGYIVEIGKNIESSDCEIIDATGCYVIPGVIDDQVHFREPGLTHKGSIKEGSRAAAAGGVTSFMDMPNVKPATTTNELLKEKQKIAANDSIINYSFYLGATNDNIEEIKNIDPRSVCGLKLFMGSSTGNMLVDNPETLKEIFINSPVLIAAHCEDTPTINANIAKYKEIYGEDIPVTLHDKIRSREACYKSSSLAASLAKEYGARLHILHLSSAEEVELLDKGNINEKKITGEVCVHHLFFNNSAYSTMGNFVRWNPAIKEESDRKALISAINNGIINVVATDHAPHTIEEKTGSYTKAAGGGPLVQHSLVMMLELAERGETIMQKVVETMCHAPAQLYNIDKRGFIRKGYKADICIFKKESWSVSKENILYKCGWSPLEGKTFTYKVVETIVNGATVYKNGSFNEEIKGELLQFAR